MRRLLFSAVLGAAAGLVGQAQPSGSSHANDSLPQIPFGQTFLDFHFPYYQNGILSATLSAVSAKGITLNRAETNDLKVDLYTDGKVTTTITSPKADLYVNERKMRTKNTVQVDRADLVATAQTCDFDLSTKKYILRQKVRVLLKHFDAGTPTKSAPTADTPPPTPDDTTAPMVPVPASPTPTNAQAAQSLLDVPGASAAPASPSSPATP